MSALSLAHNAPHKPQQTFTQAFQLPLQPPLALQDYQFTKHLIMPRGGEYSDGPTNQSDNAIESGENKLTGAPQGGSDVSYLPMHVFHGQLRANHKA